ncbi:hypothetical protein BB560_005878 [Smittium megazygosporum]|uniref:EamA domain-containing protein n=1 Tax=Smittium megazygosporum TaxID=133381 RepID=A0A2T9YS84_9FUNG|nr:hypothetical protein BB560_005878 [Smittium megazygosporum]
MFLLQTNTIFYSVLGGLNAALASLFAKLAVDSHTNIISEYILSLLLSSITALKYYYPIGLKEFTGFDLILKPENISYAVKALFVFLILVTNSLMWLFYSKSLAATGENSSSIAATGTQNLSNFCFTAFFGYIVFGSTMPSKWYLGIFFITVGLTLLSTTESSSNDANKKINKPKYSLQSKLKAQKLD